MTLGEPLALLLLPVVAYLALRAWAGRRGGPALLVADLGPVAAAARRTWRVRLRGVPTVLRALALVLVVIAVARPREGLTVTTIPEEGIDVVVAMDVSSSMTARVSGESVSRLGAAQDVLADFVETLEGNRVGIVVFQARALTLSPLTSDLAAIRSRVDTLAPGLVPDGTAIGLGLSEALLLVQDSPAESRVVVLLTDGENNAGDISPLEAARVAERLGVTVYTIGFLGGGFGTIDSQMLTNMAETTGGRFFDARTTTELSEAYEEIGSLETSALGERRFTTYREFAPWIAAAAVGLLVVEGGLRATWLRRHP
ncbi:MAG: VWA domain-containing protein [Dehalococcoidia bacterium]